MNVLSAVLVAALILPGCGAAGDARRAAEVTDSAGTRIVVSRAPAWGQAEGWRLASEPLVSIGELSGADTAAQFTRITAVTRLSGGDIAVLDGPARALRFFDSSGSHILTAGGQGRGPGEFSFPVTMIRLPGDTLVVNDRNRRHLMFDGGGDYLGQEVFDRQRLAELGPWSKCAEIMLPDRSKLMCAPEPGHELRPNELGPGHWRSFSRYVRLSFDLSSLDTLGLHGGMEQWGVKHGGRIVFPRHPFHARTHVATGVDPMRIAVARNPDYSIEVWTPTGELGMVIRRPDGRRAPTAKELEVAEELMVRGAMGDDALANRFRAEVPIPDSIPAVHGLVMAATGELWVRTTPLLPTGSTSGSVAYDIFDPRGAWLGEIATPAGLVIHEIGEDYVLGVERDEMDVEQVSLYSLDKVGLR